MRLHPLALFVLLLGCRHAAEADGGSPAEDTAVRDDLRILCERVTAREISAWSQPVFRSPTIRDLTIAVDRNDDDARCRLSSLMREHRLHECREVADGLRQSCDR